MMASTWLRVWRTSCAPASSPSAGLGSAPRTSTREKVLPSASVQVKSASRSFATEALSPLAAVCTNSPSAWRTDASRSEEHTSELQSHVNLVCRLLLEKKKKNKNNKNNN